MCIDDLPSFSFSFLFVLSFRMCRTLNNRYTCGACCCMPLATSFPIAPSTFSLQLFSHPSKQTTTGSTTTATTARAPPSNHSRTVASHPIVFSFQPRSCLHHNTTAIMDTTGNTHHRRTHHRQDPQQRSGGGETHPPASTEKYEGASTVESTAAGRGGWREASLDLGAAVPVGSYRDPTASAAVAVGAAAATSTGCRHSLHRGMQVGNNQNHQHRRRCPGPPARQPHFVDRPLPSVGIFPSMALDLWKAITSRKGYGPNNLLTKTMDEYRAHQNRCYGDLLPSFPIFFPPPPQPSKFTTGFTSWLCRLPPGSGAAQATTGSPAAAATDTSSSRGTCTRKRTRGDATPPHLAQPCWTQDDELPPHIFSLQQAMETACSPRLQVLEPACLFIALHFYALLSEALDTAPVRFMAESRRSRPNPIHENHNLRFSEQHPWVLFMFLLSLAHKLHGELLFSYSFFIASMLPSAVTSTAAIPEQFAFGLKMDLVAMESALLPLFGYNLSVSPQDLDDTLTSYLPPGDASYIRRLLHF